MEDSEVARNNWRGYAVGHQGFDTVFKWGGSRDGVIRRSRFFDNLGGGIWFDGDNQRMLVEDSFSARNKTHGVFAEANGGPITVRRSKVCENGTDGMMNSRSNNVTLDANQLFNNGYWQIATTGNDTPLTVTDWQTGQTYVADARNWTITNNTVVGRPLASGAVPSACYPGPCGWTVWIRSGRPHLQDAHVRLQSVVPQLHDKELPRPGHRGHGRRSADISSAYEHDEDQ